MICRRCILTDAFPGVTFDAAGLCSHCRRAGEGGPGGGAEERARYAARFAELLEQVRAPEAAAGRAYDVLMAFSGGKDSTYTLALLRRTYGLRVLALSFDNGFVSPAARGNIQRTADALGVDHLFFRPRWDLLRRAFAVAAERELYPRKTLERASTICTTCMGVVKAACLRTAIEQGIPLIGYGWSPGQAPVQSSIMRTNPAFARMAQDAVLRPLREAVGEQVAGWFLGERHFAAPERFPWNVHPLAWVDYDEGAIRREIARLGWAPPEDTDPNSTNCLLNALGNEVHQRRHGFHPYVWEIANMVRAGVLSREEGLAKFAEPVPEGAVAAVRERLGLPVAGASPEGGR